MKLLNIFEYIPLLNVRNCVVNLLLRLPCLCLIITNLVDLCIAARLEILVNMNVVMIGVYTIFISEFFIYGEY